MLPKGEFQETIEEYLISGHMLCNFVTHICSVSWQVIQDYLIHLPYEIHWATCPTSIIVPILDFTLFVLVLNQWMEGSDVFKF